MIDKKADIFKAGRELFYSQGFKDTNVSDITKKAGIGVGTFYNYYPSKEKLFLEVYFKENEGIKKRIVESLDLNDDPVAIMNKFVSQSLRALNSNMILRQWYNQDIFRELEKYYNQEEKKNCYFVDDLCRQLFKKWQAEGKIRADIDEDLFLAFFQSLAYIDTHKEDIGIGHFPRLMQYLAEFIINGLTEKA